MHFLKWWIFIVFVQMHYFCCGTVLWCKLCLKMNKEANQNLWIWAFCLTHTHTLTLTHSQSCVKICIPLLISCCCLFSSLLIVLSQNILSEACRIWHCHVFSWFFSEHSTVWPWGKPAEMSTPVKIGSRLLCFQLLNDLSHCRMLNSNLSGNGLTTLFSD